MTKSSDIRLLVVRTGTTEWEEAGRICGRCDLPLSERGRESVRAGLETLNGSASLGLVLCGPDDTSRATAELVSKTTGARVKVLDDLQEMNLGLWEGLRASDLEEKYPTAYRKWTENPESVVVPEGETLAAARERIIEALARGLGKVRDEDGAVGVVLRPVGFAIVVAWLEGSPGSELWGILNARPGMNWYTVPRAMIKDAREQIRAGS
jgi:broad specificity phosphatase PhoE